ncbi:hypothetical protein FNV43_RR02297 [Rhamnella rubrinervis]|uniref:LRAT domain-containing protein n=1 Tax=Rhamnella rubrinervis TaxID=2594499 RepID=A0A8K0MTL8_9ROSA|nr:hypothetical protein FNV43_RR02297 [Rhamnella rubrinervis]
MSSKIGRDELRPGDHIYTWRSGYSYSHHGIYVSDGKVIHLTRRPGLLKSSSSSQSSDDHVECCDIEDFLCDGQLYRFEYGVSQFVFLTKRPGTCSIASSNPPEQVLPRASYLLEYGFGKYDLLNRNCEDFAIYCKTGFVKNEYQGSFSGQIKSLTSVIVAVTIIPYRFLPASLVGVALVVCGLYCFVRLCSDAGWRRRDFEVVTVEKLAHLSGVYCKMENTTPRWFLPDVSYYLSKILWAIRIWYWTPENTTLLWFKSFLLFIGLSIIVSDRLKLHGFKLGEYSAYTIWLLGHLYWKWTSNIEMLGFKEGKRRSGKRETSQRNVSVYSQTPRVLHMPVQPMIRNALSYCQNNLVREILEENSAEEVLKLKISAFAGDDRLFWTGASSGIFSVKNAYLVDKGFDNSEDGNGLWKDLCVLCGNAMETVAHLFCHCNVIKAITFGSKWGLKWDYFAANNLDSLLELCMKPKESDCLGDKRKMSLMLILAMYSIWHLRNDILHKGEQDIKNVIFTFERALEEHYAVVEGSPSILSGKKEESGPGVPRGSFSVNTDIATDTFAKFSLKDNLSCFNVDVRRDAIPLWIYVDDGKVIHLTRGPGLIISSSSAQSSDDRVVCCDMEDFLCDGQLYRFEYGVSRSEFLMKRPGTCSLASSDPPEQVLHRASYLLEYGFVEKLADLSDSLNIRENMNMMENSTTRWFLRHVYYHRGAILWAIRIWYWTPENTTLLWFKSCLLYTLLSIIVSDRLKLHGFKLGEYSAYTMWLLESCIGVEVDFELGSKRRRNIVLEGMDAGGTRGTIGSEGRRSVSVSVLFFFFLSFYGVDIQQDQEGRTQAWGSHNKAANCMDYREKQPSMMSLWICFGEVIHLTRRPGLLESSSSSQSSDDRVECSDIEDFLCDGQLYRFEYGVSRFVLLTKRPGTCGVASSNPPEQVLHRAFYLLEYGFGNYDLLERNCEDFAIYCKTGLVGVGGLGCSGQVNSLLAAFFVVTFIPYGFLPVGLIGVALAHCGLYCFIILATDAWGRRDFEAVEILVHNRRESMIENSTSRWIRILGWTPESKTLLWLQLFYGLSFVFVICYYLKLFYGYNSFMV